jgi:hypothetical protein
MFCKIVFLTNLWSFTPEQAAAIEEQLRALPDDAVITIEDVPAEQAEAFRNYVNAKSHEFRAKIEAGKVILTREE